jgi:hypothetical protein
LGTGGSSGRGGSSGSSGSGGAQGTGGRVGSGGATGAGGTTTVPGSGGSGGGADAGSKSDGSSGTVSYAKDIQPLLEANCTRCHGGSRPSAGIDLTSYDKVKPNAAAANSAIQKGAMPPTGALSAANKQLFQAWVNAGTPNN